MDTAVRTLVTVSARGRGRVFGISTDHLDLPVEPTEAEGELPLGWRMLQ